MRHIDWVPHRVLHKTLAVRRHAIQCFRSGRTTIVTRDIGWSGGTVQGIPGVTYPATPSGLHPQRGRPGPGSIGLKVVGLAHQAAQFRQYRMVGHRSYMSREPTRGANTTVIPIDQRIVASSGVSSSQLYRPFVNQASEDFESARELCGLLPLRGWRNAKARPILPGGA
jgi:hypothetical protein